MKKLVFIFIFSLLFKSSFSQRYIPGAYYTPGGERIEGLIEHIYSAHFGQRPDNAINFKKTADSKKIKITTEEARSFVSNTDSFIIIKDFVISGDVRYKEDFVKIVKTGKINLYKHYTTGMRGTYVYKAETYLLEKDGKPVEVNKRIFKDNFKSFFGDNIELIKKIESKVLSYDDLEQIVEEYNQ